MEDKAPLIKKIKDDINKTGFPSEIVAGDILLRDGRETEYNVYYIDLDENKGREIDIIATTPIFNENHQIYLEHSLICAVKKSVKPWIIFSTEEIFEPGSKIPDITASEGIGGIISSDDLTNKSTVQFFERFGRSYYVAFRGNNTEIFDALCSSVKASEASRMRFEKQSKEDGGMTIGGLTWRVLCIYEPLVILDGQMFEAFLDPAKRLVIQEATHLPIRFGYLSNNYRHSENSFGYVVEVVTIDKLNQLLIDKRRWLKSVMNSIVEGANRTEIEAPKKLK